MVFCWQSASLLSPTACSLLKISNPVRRVCTDPISKSPGRRSQNGWGWEGPLLQYPGNPGRRRSTGRLRGTVGPDPVRIRPLSTPASRLPPAPAPIGKRFQISAFQQTDKLICLAVKLPQLIERIFRGILLGISEGHGQEVPASRQHQGQI